MRDGAPSKTTSALKRRTISTRLSTRLAPMQNGTTSLPGDVLHGHDAIRSFYGDLFAGFPDFWLNIRNRRPADDAIIVDGLLEVRTLGNGWASQPRAGRCPSRFCAVFTFTEDDMIKSETAYYDRLTILEQLGLLAS